MVVLRRVEHDRQVTAGAEGVAVKDLVITWTPVQNATAYIVEIEQDELEVNLKATLPEKVSTFKVPNGFLRPGTDYKIAIGTVMKVISASFASM